MDQIRMVNSSDIPALKEVLETIELFPAEMLEEMIADYLDNSETEDIWFTTVQNEKPVSIGYCAPEKLTDGTYNLYAIGVRSDIQAKGLGSQMMTFIEEYLESKGKRLLVVDTSSSDAFKRTRQFYEKLNYEKEAVIRDFWEEGDDKVTYIKRLKKA